MRGLLVTAWIIAFGATPFAAAEPPSMRAVLEAPVGAETSAPIGWIDFCDRHAGECMNREAPPTRISFTPEFWEVLRLTNDLVNRTIEPVSDPQHWDRNERWDYPSDGKGDCEDYALWKRILLAKHGYPIQALLMTIVYRRGDAEAHAVLMVRTSVGDFILDNRRDIILNWSDTGYEFLKRQSQDNQNRWVAFGNKMPSPSVVSAQSNQ